jgi:uncharacterized RDD family membrane protein YckC
VSERPVERYEDIIGSEARQVVVSPEQVQLHLPVAGPTSRILAYGIDFVLILGLEMSLFAVLAASTGLLTWLARWLRPFLPDPAHPSQAPDPTFLLYLLALFLIGQLAVEWSYFVLCELATGGRSLGKALVGLRVVTDTGMKIGLRESLMRNLLRTVDLLPSNYLVGLVAMVLSPQSKRLGDLAAGTVVIRLDRPPALAPLAEDDDDPADTAFRFAREQIARMGPAERALVRNTLRRLDTLSPTAAAAALERTVEALRARLDYEPVDPSQGRAFLRALRSATRTR